MNFTKKISILFLLAIFLFNTMGYFVVFKVAQYEIKKNIVSEIKSGVASSYETIFEINKKDVSKIVWFENGNEMIYNQARYDVIKIDNTQNSIKYHCIKDDAESTLFANLDEHINTNVISSKPIKNNNSKNLKNNVVKIFYQNNFSFSFSQSITPFTFSSFNLIYTSRVIPTNTPPPEFV